MTIHISLRFFASLTQRMPESADRFAVSPGATIGEILSALGISEDEAYETVCRMYCILGRGQTAEDISNGVLFLCSEEARNVNGHVLYVDAGFLGI